MARLYISVNLIASWNNTNWVSVTSTTSYSANVSFSLSSSSCTKTVYVWFKDSAGNVSVVVSDSITYSPTTTNWSSVSAGYYHTIAIKTDWTLWAWGFNNYGQLGDGTTTNRSSPTQIGSGTNWSSVSAGGYHTVAIKTDGTLWVWGNNGNGKLGDGTTTDRYSPVQIGRGTNWSTVSAGGYHTVAIKTDGTLWVWGNNGNGKLGDGTTTDRYSPVQIGSGTNWSSVSTGGHHTIAIKTDGTLWAWGYNVYGGLGDGTTTDRTTPTQIGVSWTMLKLPDTGQTTSYTTTYGEDHDYTINPPSYTDNGNGTITDNVTGLMWQKEDDNNTRTWSNAVTYCDNLTLGGQSDWRLPSKKEFISRVNYGTYSPSINTTYFPNTNSSGYWSSTTAADNSSYAWFVGFSAGNADSYGKSNYWYVQCVRGEGQTMTKNFTDNGNGTVTDNDTGLMWQKEDDDVTRTWESAIIYCEGLSLGSYSDWRLPNIKELESITDATKDNPAIDTTYFPNTNSSSSLAKYWSSTTYMNDSSSAWSVSYYSNIYMYYKSYDYYVRCVRG